MNTEKQINGTGNSTKNQGTSPPPRARIGRVESACLLFLISSLAEAGASTPVSGLVAGGHWTTAGSPYNVVGDVQVYGTLTIDAGVLVRSAGVMVLPLKSPT